MILVYQIQLNRDSWRERGEKRLTINKTTSKLRESRRSLVSVLRRIDEPPLDPSRSSRTRGRELFRGPTPTLWVIYLYYKSARLPRRDACNACLCVRGRSNASIIHDPRRPSSICARESVSMCCELSRKLSFRTRTIRLILIRSPSVSR